MQTSFTKDFSQSKDGGRVNDILRSCVHCGFCNATCPTYQITGNELDGPRGRIYLIKNYFEEPQDQENKKISLHHLDRCLTCLGCETTCPSGVKYGELIDIGRKHIDSKIERNYFTKIKRKLIIFFFSHPKRVASLINIARIFKPFLPNSLARKIPSKPITSKPSPTLTHDNKVLTIRGCVQSTLAPQINLSASKVLSDSGIQQDEASSRCCGALAFHMTDLEKAYRTIRRNIDDWHEKLSSTHDILSITSSGCSSFIKQYATIMQDDESYAEKAKFISGRCRDLTEMAGELKIQKQNHQTVALHNPCTLQHAQKIEGVIEAILKEAGYRLVNVKDAHLCCGSAGSYSLLQSSLSSELLKSKVQSLEEEQPDIIATANIGCLVHLQSGTDIPIKHWIELLA